MRSTMMILAAIAAAAAPAGAQLPSGLGSLGGQGGLSGLLGGAMPNIGSTTTGNAAGVLSYCVKNRLLAPGSGATSALGALTGKAGVTASPGYAAGSTGTLVTGGGNQFSLDSVKGKVKAKVCDMVLQHARAML